MDKDEKEQLQRVAGVPKPPGFLQRRRMRQALWAGNAMVPTPDTDKQVMNLVTELHRRGKMDPADLELLTKRIGEIIRNCAAEVSTQILTQAERNQ